MVRCSKCHGEWNAPDGEVIEVCPFCKAPLKPVDTSVKGALRWIVQDRGVSVYQNASVINSILADLVKDEEKDRRRIKLALSTGIGEEFCRLLQKYGEVTESGKKYLIDYLADLGTERSFGEFIVDIFAYSVMPEEELQTLNERVSSPKIVDENSTEQLVESDCNIGNLSGRNEPSDQTHNNAKELNNYPIDALQARNDSDDGNSLNNVSESGTEQKPEKKDEIKVEGDPNGRSILRGPDYVIDGFRKNGLWNGPFFKMYNNGPVYEGTYVNGAVEGKLTFRDADSNTFICDWHDGNWNGEGRYETPDGVLTGTWADGEIKGEGKFTYRDGHYYVGGFKGFQKDGRGKIVIPAKKMEIDCQFKDDIISGPVKIHFENGDTYNGAWNNAIDGHGTFCSENCPGIDRVICIGKWKDGMPSESCDLTMEIKEKSYLVRGSFFVGKIYGNATVYVNGEKTPTFTGKWRQNKIEDRLKSIEAKNAEKYVQMATAYINEVTAKANVK